VTIRPAAKADIQQMVALSEDKRSQYKEYAPTFWRKAAGASESQARFFKTLLEREQVIALIHETGDRVDGFVVATVRNAPPVYDPGTAICAIDDFCVAVPEDWATVGAQLLQKVRQAARGRGAELAVVVCGARDEPKRAMLQRAGFAVASEWYVNPL
jgi:hypothetical protein